MAHKVVRVAHYLNQFFAGIGGEEQANLAPTAQEKPVGPGIGLARLFSGEASVVGTVICGDNYFNEHAGSAVMQIIELIKKLNADVLIAGPAFGSGRYGVACAQVCKAAVETLGLPAITAMQPDNPGVSLGLPLAYVVPTGETAVSMRDALSAIAPLAVKLGRGDSPGAPVEGKYLPRGVRINRVREHTGAERALETLLSRVRGSEWRTELPLPTFDRVQPPKPISDLRKARIALVCEGGVVPKGNPDRLESRRASKWLRYSIHGVDNLTADRWESVHGGFDTSVANADPDRIVPVDALRLLETDGSIGALHDDYWTTSGAGTSLEVARHFGEEIAAELASAKIDGALMVAT